MAMKRGATGLSLVVGVDKPVGMSSHDVVNRCRRIFGEKRIGHTGTLDPLASGAMAVCIGPATKLSAHLTAHDKEYLARIVLGTATATDDREGEVLRELPVPAALHDEETARTVLEGLVGRHKQLPPAYSAVKVGGVKSYEAARKGNVIDLRPREIEIYRAQLVGLGTDEAGRLCWDARFSVSAGTYIRSIARDLGTANGTCAHLGGLRRLRSGRLSLGQCVSLEALEKDPQAAVLDPVRLLGLRFLVVDDARRQKAVVNGGKLSVRGVRLLECLDVADAQRYDSCVPAVVTSQRPLVAGEEVAVLVDNKLLALYEYDGALDCLKSVCGFAQGVARGTV